MWIMPTRCCTLFSLKEVNYDCNRNSKCYTAIVSGRQTVKPEVYIETSIPSFYFEVRTEPEMVARREWTRTGKAAS